MNILIISGPNPQKAGIVAFDLNEGFKKKGHKSKLLTIYHNNKNEDTYSVHNSLSWFFYRVKNKILSLLTKNKKIKTDKDYYFLDICEKKEYFSSDRIIKKIKFKPDVILICFAQNFINSKVIYELYQKTKAPIFWYLMDMAPFTGGCHYSWDCKGYQSTCGHCPGLFSNKSNDISFVNHKYKISYLEKTDIRAIAGSDWLFQQTKNSSVFRGKQLSKILLGIDSDIFKPVDRKQARQKFKLPENKKIIFFGAVNLSEKRKGGDILLQALHDLKELITDTKIEIDIHILVAGNNAELLFQNFCFGYTSTGFLKGKHELASAYQSADVFVSPSIEDSGPMMVNQSIMCGTPVVAFDIGVAKDLIIDGETGYKVNLGDSKKLAQGIYQILEKNEDEYLKMSVKCRELAIETIHPEVQIINFLKLFNNK